MTHAWESGEGPSPEEILAERTGTTAFAMLLYDDELPLTVAHVTLHLSLKDALPLITTAGVLEKEAVGAEPAWAAITRQAATTRL